jgi:phage baseplate assembly protein W
MAQYSDISLSFVPNPLSGDVRPVTDEAAVKNSLLNLIRTPVGTRPSNLDYGSRVEEYLFAQADPETEAELNEEVASSIERFEPRAMVVSVESNILDYGVEIIVEYYVKNFKDKQILRTVISRTK